MTNGFSTTRAQPAVTIVDIDDMTAANAGMHLLKMEGMPLQSMPLQARRVIVRLKSATVVYHSTNLRLRTRTQALDGLLAFVTFGPRASGTVDGLRVRPGMLLVARPDIEAGFVVDPGWEGVDFLVPQEDIREHLSARRREDAFHWPRGVDVLRTDATRARALFRWGKRLIATASKAPTLFEEGHAERDAAQVELLEALLTVMRSADPVAPAGKERTRQSHARIVRMAEDHVLSRIGEPVHVSDLCLAADVSERTLEYAFREVVGLSPVSYLIRLRLHKVRAALRAAEPGSTQVSAEALKWGFWHFGEFSRAYKQCFGELPSDTLRRKYVSPALLRDSTARE